MRVGHVLEWYTSESVAGISLVNNLLALGSACNQIEPTFFELPIPPAEAAVSVPDRYFEKPWLRVHHVGDPKRMEGYEFAPPRPELIDVFRPMRKNSVVVDSILNAKFMHSAAIALGLEVSPGRWYQAIEIPVVTHLTETGLDKRLPLMNRLPARALLRAGATVGPTIVMQEQDAEWMRDVAGGDVFVVPPIIDSWHIDERFEQYERQRSERPTPVAFHGGSLESKRHLPEIAEACRGILPAVFTTQATPKTSPFPEHVELHRGVQRDQYLDMLGAGDILVCAAEYEGTGLAYMEAIRSGMIPVVFDAPWIRPRLPEGYPLVARSWDEFRLALRMAVDNWPSVKKAWQQSLIEHLDGFGGLSAAQTFLNTMREISSGTFALNVSVATKAKPAFDLLADAVQEEERSEWTLPEARRAIKERSDAKSDFGVSNYAVRWMLIALGYRDACDGPAPRMVREVTRDAGT